MSRSEEFMRDLEAEAAEYGYKLGWVDARVVAADAPDETVAPVFVYVKRGGLDPDNAVSLRIAAANRDDRPMLDLAVAMRYEDLVALIANPDDEPWEDGE